MCAAGTPHAGRIRLATETLVPTFLPAGMEIRGRPRATQAIPTADGGGAAGGGDAAHDRTVRNLVEARQIVGQRRADTARRPNSPE